ncbi:hypothetical protein AB1N83_009104 [Pleurotus pulmonarius]
MANDGGIRKCLSERFKSLWRRDSDTPFIRTYATNPCRYKSIELPLRSPISPDIQSIPPSLLTTNTNNSVGKVYSTRLICFASMIISIFGP